MPDHLVLQPVRPTVSIKTLIFLSVAVSSFYYWSIGYSALIEGLKNALAGGSADIATLRLASYTENRYLYPGYVNQFKNVLLPALTLVIFAYWYKVGKRPWITMMLLAGCAIFGLLGTGQRGAFVQFSIVAALYLYLANGLRFPRSILRLALAAVILTAISTVALGRSSGSLPPGATTLDHVKVTGRELAGRVFHDQQFSAVAGFRYIYGQPIQWGREWGQGLLGMLPGRGGSDLSNRIFAVLYGSNRGTSPPSIWGSVYNNFGWIGIIIFPSVLAIILVAISRRATAPGPRTSLELVGIAGCSVTLGLWGAGSPDYLFNSGLAVYIFLWTWGSHIRQVPIAALRTCGGAGVTRR